ncbi:nuclear transport factor 2 family protein [Isoptericola sp. BMS4]|uniref:nuclear transport factor 2 family protein n=1 Tax=Isoptericola sp. BMS4 TaxID=2527875 RepID=UPI00141EB528|nr:nuclear transport factor 2 family protein [Isoptericola sp. BMS4]
MAGEEAGDGGLRAELAAFLRDWAAAVVANDPERIDAFVAPTWALVGTDRYVIDRARFLAVVRSGELTHSRMTFDVVTARADGDTATTFSRSANAGTWRGRAFTAEEWVSDAFVRRDGRWLALMTTVVPAGDAPVTA